MTELPGKTIKKFTSSNATHEPSSSPVKKNKSKNLKVILTLAVMFFVLASLPIAIYLVNQSQEIRKEAKQAAVQTTAAPAPGVEIVIYPRPLVPPGSMGSQTQSDCAQARGCCCDDPANCPTGCSRNCHDRPCCWDVPLTSYCTTDSTCIPEATNYSPYYVLHQSQVSGFPADDPYENGYPHYNPLLVLLFAPAQDEGGCCHKTAPADNAKWNVSPIGTSGLGDTLADRSGQTFKIPQNVNKITGFKAQVWSRAETTNWRKFRWAFFEYGSSSNPRKSETPIAQSSGRIDFPAKITGLNIPVTPGRTYYLEFFDPEDSSDGGAISWQSLALGQYDPNISNLSGGTAKSCKAKSGVEATANKGPYDNGSAWVHSMDSNTCNTPTRYCPFDGAVKPDADIANLTVLGEYTCSPPPTDLSASCKNGQGFVMWRGSALQYALRIDDTFNGWVGNCSQTQNEGDYCIDDLYNNSYTFTAKPGHTYKWWVHSVDTIDGHQCVSDLISGTDFTCPAKTCSIEGISPTTKTVNVGERVTISYKGKGNAYLSPTPTGEPIKVWVARADGLQFSEWRGVDCYPKIGADTSTCRYFYNQIAMCTSFNETECGVGSTGTARMSQPGWYKTFCDVPNEPPLQKCSGNPHCNYENQGGTLDCSGLGFTSCSDKDNDEFMVLKNCSVSLTGVGNTNPVSQVMAGEQVTFNTQGIGSANPGSEKVKIWVAKADGGQFPECDPLDSASCYRDTSVTPNRWYRSITACDSANASECSTSLPFSLSQAGTYKVHCDLGFNPNPPKPPRCTGNLFCRHEGGDQDCTGWVSCSDQDNTTLNVLPGPTGTPTPTATPTLTPTPTATPTPTPTLLPLACQSFGRTPTSQLNKGDSVLFTCIATSDVATPINHFEFRVSKDSGAPVPLPTALPTGTGGQYQGQINYTIPDYGCYNVECRACTSTDQSVCTNWGQ